MRLLPSAAHVTHKSADLSCTLWCNYKVPPRCGNTRGRGTEGGSSHAPRRIREMAVGRPRGKNGAVPLYLYDPASSGSVMSGRSPLSKRHGLPSPRPGCSCSLCRTVLKTRLLIPATGGRD
jgi:hypothetical protein